MFEGEERKKGNIKIVNGIEYQIWYVWETTDQDRQRMQDLADLNARILAKKSK